MPNIRKYPWDRWLRRRRLVLTRGVQFHCEPHGMAQQVRNAAAKRNKRVSININGSTVRVEISRA